MAQTEAAVVDPRNGVDDAGCYRARVGSDDYFFIAQNRWGAGGHALPEPEKFNRLNPARHPTGTDAPLFPSINAEAAAAVREFRRAAKAQTMAGGAPELDADDAGGDFRGMRGLAG